MSEFISQYYALLSSLTNWVTPPLSAVADSINIPVFSVLLFGMMGAVAPCQLSTNVATLAFLSRGVTDARKIGAQTLAFVAGKVTIYMLVGGVVVLLGWQINQLSGTLIPIVIVARRALGPLLIIVGLFMLSILQFKFSVGTRLSYWLETKVGRRQGVIPAYLLGVAFAFAFCPTLFWLFFGLTIPLAIASPGGLVFPGVFAIGTALPVLGLSAIVASGMVNMGQLLRQFKVVDVWIQHLAGIIFILVGLNETVLYWLL